MFYKNGRISLTRRWTMNSEKTRAFILNLLNSNGDTDPCSNDDLLISNNRLSSLGIAELMLHLEDEYDIYISTSDSNIFAKLDSINLINAYISMSKKEVNE